MWVISSKLGAVARGDLGLAGAHGVTRGANIKRELMPLLNIANVLCLGCRNHAKDAKESRDDQRSHGSLLNHMIEYSPVQASRSLRSRLSWPPTSNPERPQLVACTA